MTQAATLQPDISKFLAFADELKRLRSDAHAAELRLFRRAAEIEASTTGDTWKEFYGSFDGFLQEYNICQPARYRNFQAAVQMPDIEAAADQMGVATTIQAGKLADPARRAKMIEASIERTRVTGVPWSDQEAKRVRLLEGGSEPKDSAWNKRHSEYEKLREENVALKKRIQAMEDEVAALQEENERLRKGSLERPKKARR